MVFFACKQKEVEFICYGKKMYISLVMAQLLMLLKDQIILNNLKPVSTSQPSQKALPGVACYFELESISGSLR